LTMTPTMATLATAAFAMPRLRSNGTAT
jgi:hypothetical protein